MSCIKKLINIFNRASYNNRVVPIRNDSSYIAENSSNIVVNHDDITDFELQSIIEDISLQQSQANRSSKKVKKKRKKNNYTCPICLEKLTKDTPYKIVCKNKKCRTHYHRKCLTEWNKNKPPGDLKCLVCTMKTINISRIPIPSCPSRLQLNNRRSPSFSVNSSYERTHRRQPTIRRTQRVVERRYVSPTGEITFSDLNRHDIYRGSSNINLMNRNISNSYYSNRDSLYRTPIINSSSHNNNYYSNRSRIRAINAY
tara:strand:- start:1007 stop:1774 length:768 start_codon:yes stop_codon:yes gene_type:complete